MTDPITSAELDLWEKVERAATLGPWNPVETGISTEEGRKVWLIKSPALRDGYCDSSEDALLAAVARNAFPRLISEIRRLRDDLAVK
jgi:hypothetical protein